MLIIVYAIALILFWILALRLNPERYPQVEPAALALFRQYKLSLYRRYAALLVVWILIAIINGVVVNMAGHHPSPFWRTAAWSMVSLTLAFVVVLFYYILRNAIRNHRHGKAIGMR